MGVEDWRREYRELGGDTLTTADELYNQILRKVKSAKRKVTRKKDPRKAD